MSDNVYIFGVGMSKFGRHLDKTIKILTGEALELVLKDSGLDRSDIEAAWFSNSYWGLYTMQHGIRGQVALSANGLDGVPITNLENACGGGSSALHGAWTGVKAGLYDCVLALGAEKIYDTDRGKMMLSFATGSDVDDWAKTAELFKTNAPKEKKPAEAAAGASGEGEKDQGKKKSHSPAMDMYAYGARRAMSEHGMTQRQLAVVASKAHNNSVMNPLAQYTFPMTVDEVLADREVAYPLTRAMCAPVGDGAAAVILCSERFLRSHSARRAVAIRASILRSGKRDGGHDTGPRAAKAAFEVAGIGPEDIDVAEVHDATAYGEVATMEELGLCPVGEGGPFAESGATALDGKLPINTGGGLIARGHPVGATGLAQAYELTTQLRGEAGERQIESPRIALAENGGGMLGSGPAAMCIHVLEAPAKS
jgi:acetyl-CoA acetyltransferase